MIVKKMIDKKMRFFFFLCLSVCSVCSVGIFFPQPVWGANERVYSIVPSLNIRELPSPQAKSIHRLRHGRWVTVVGKSGEWLHVQLPDGKEGYAFSEMQG